LCVISTIGAFFISGPTSLHTDVLWIPHRSLTHLVLMFLGGVCSTRMDFPLDSICPPLWGSRTRILMLRIIQGLIVTMMYTALVYTMQWIGIWILYLVLFGERHWRIKERLYRGESPRTPFSGPNEGEHSTS
jgi:hypothetical protein